MPFTAEGKLDLFVAFIKARDSFTVPKRTKTAQGGKFNFTYAPLDEIIAATAPHLAKEGLAVFNNVTMPGSNVVSVTAVMVHTSGQFHETDPVIFQTDGSPQSAGAAITYGRRYTQSALLGIASEEDTDAPDLKREQAAGKRNAASNAPVQEPDDPSKADEPITPAQIERLKRIVKTAGVKNADMKAWLTSMDIASSAAIKRSQYQNIVNVVQAGNVPKAAA
jgi:hypothetical protein